MADLNRVTPELAQRITYMIADGKSQGLTFQIACGFRPLADQRQLYNAYKADPKHNPIAAVPGTSNHGKLINGVQRDATAVDLDVIPQSGTNLVKHLQLAHKWGLFRAVKGEYWHLELDPKRSPITRPPTTNSAEQGNEDDMPGPQGQIDAALNQTGPGHWVLTRDGGVRANGGAPFHGSYPGLPAAQRQGDRFFIAIESNAKGGYSLIASDDARYDFGPQ